MSKICSKCGIEQSFDCFGKRSKSLDGFRHECKTCIKEYNALYRKQNKEQISKQKKEYRKQNKEKISDYFKVYNKIFRAELTNYSGVYYKKNKDRVLSHNRKYKKSDKGIATTKSHKQKRRAIKVKSTGQHNAQDILKLFDLQSHQCVYCKSTLENIGKNKYHIDHIVPLSKNGSNGIENIQLLCPSCNLRKSNKLPEDFAASIGMLL